MAVTEQGAPRTAHDPPRAIFVRFLKFGALAWGGPAAQIAMIKHECVDQEGWVDEETFKKTLTVYQVLPGPEAHELCVYFGRIRGGKLGGFLAGLGFMLPGFLLMLGLSILYVEADLARHLDELFYGLKAAVGALLARALVRLSRLLYHGRSARSPRGGSLRPDRLRICELCLGPPRGRHRLRTVDKRAPVDPADSRLFPGASRTPRRCDRSAYALADGRDFLGGLEGRPRDLRRSVHRHPLPPRRHGGGPALAYRHPVRGWSRDERRPPRTAHHLLDLCRLHRGRTGRRAGYDARDLPARVRSADLLSPLARGDRREPARAPIPARSRGSRDRADRRSHGRRARRERGGRTHRRARNRGLRGAEPLAREACGRRRRPRLRGNRSAPPNDRLGLAHSPNRVDRTLARRPIDACVTQANRDP